MIIETKWQIWKNRNGVRYGSKKSENVEIIFRSIKKGLQDDLTFYKLKVSKIRNKLDSIIDNTINIC